MLTPHKVYSQVDLQLKVSDTIQIFANKGMSREQGNIFEALGNVVIVDENQTLYGEKAKYNKKTGDLSLDGNVRLVSSGFNLYGSSIDYNYLSKNISIKNARLISPNFKVIAGSIKRMNSQEYYTEKAEFTTCLDCPESWTIFGEKIKITLNEYVQITGALVRLKGMDFFYVPYLVFPIKSQRETGLLVPTYRNSGFNGHSLFVPWFWAINKSTDLTLSPSVYSKRGLGADLEFRKVFNNESYSFTDLRFHRDSIFKKSYNQTYRLGLMNETRFTLSKDLGFYFKVQEFSDLDFHYHHNDFSSRDLNKTEYGINGHLEYRNDLFNVGSIANLKKTIIATSPVYYDDFFDYKDKTVNHFPRLYVSNTPINIFKHEKSDLFRYLNYQGNIIFDRFRQIDPNFTYPIRNLDRFHTLHDFKLEIYNPGLFRIDSTYKFDFQNYVLKNIYGRDARKFSGVLENSFVINFERIYGKNLKRVTTEKKKKIQDAETIGELESVADFENRQSVVSYESSVRHLQEVKLSHLSIPFEKETGNQNFLSQIQTGSGLFDYLDAQRSKEQDLGQEITRVEMPYNNVLALEWNHSFIEKNNKNKEYNPGSSFVEDNFTYTKKAYFNLSQGIRLNRSGKLKNKLTRLGIETGYDFDPKLQFKFRNFYFYDSEFFIGELTVKNDFKFLKVLNQYTYNSFDQRKLYRWGVDFVLMRNFIFSVGENWNFTNKKLINRRLEVQYLGDNNCWYLGVYYLQRPNDDKFGIDFSLNFGSENYRSALRRLF